MIQGSITSNKSCWDCVPSDTMWWEGHLAYEVFFPKIHNPDLIMRKHCINANGGTFCKMPDQYSAKLSGLGKKAKDWETVLEQKRQRRHDWMPSGDLHGILGQVNDVSWRTSLVVQWFRLWASTAGGTDSIPGQRTKIPYAVWHCHKLKNFFKKDLSGETDDIQIKSGM